MSDVHDHHHHHHDHHDFASANQAFFDKHAHQADHRPQAKEMAASVCKAVLEAYPFDKEATVVLDYACGTGIVARSIAPHCKTLIGVDISQGMVDEFNTGVQDHGIPVEKMRAVRVELKGEETELEGIKFDVVMCSLAYHHIEDILAVTRLLTFFLKPGGTLIVVDYPEMDATAVPKEALPMIAHKSGISEAGIKAAYDGAGLGNFQQVLFKGPKSGMHPEDIFLAKGVKL
ncbi:S-adenosyl-L-methionine-dependent methyltransferase [Mycena albidolilacea]|uniref:S-adenosyl-L-methionine-dependent methyltransferase n=1 Tax=Mycena albidolilacea TaxID=1033008 RepID=A0AAD7A3P0_9AGAR|nr:S-adenosyl-L-methionine-dependent methyltransferase [Mycena albidolilacea]